MRRWQIVSLSVATFVLTSVGFAGSVGATGGTVPVPTRVAKTTQGEAPRVLVDSSGTVNVVWTGTAGHDSFGDSYFAVKYARKPAGSKTFTQVTLPHIFDPDEPFLFQPSAGVLVILAQGGTGDDVVGWRSTNDGKSWQIADTSALNASTLASKYQVYIQSDVLVAAPGGPILYASGTTDGADVVQVSNDLNKVTITPVSTKAQAISPRWLARAASGATFLVAEGSTYSTVLFAVGSHDGQAKFPTCAPTHSPATSLSVAAGASSAVIAEAGCGRVWLRDVTAAGKVGPLVTLGAGAIQHGDLTIGAAWVDVVADRNNHFTVGFIRPGGDLGVAHSTSGSHWSIVKGSVPVASLNEWDGQAPTISTGAATWYGDTLALDNVTYAVRAIPLSTVYRTPKAPSGSGLRDPRRGELGSLAMTVPGKIALKSFRKTGRVKVKVVSAFTGRVLLSVGDSRTSKNTTIDVCEGGAKVKLTAHHARTITLTCSGGGIVIGGVATGRTASSQIDARKGDLVQFTMSGRNGGFTVNARVT
jgi:hypothetical protein